jgi:glucosamine 6-phosphate synthetase-like amidotransferase/phosphosugar isomerase protein
MTSYTGDIYDYVMESNEYIRRIVDDREKILKSSVDYFLENNIRRLYLVGTGTSLHADIASRSVMEELLRIPVHAENAILFNDFTNIFTEETLVFANSHAGQSTSTINSLLKAKANNLKTISSTAVYDSEITKYGDRVLYCEIGEEKAGPKTKGYLCAIVTNILFALFVAMKKNIITELQEQEYIDRILKTADNIPYIAQKSDEWYKKHSDELLECRRLVIVGYENNIATYLEGTLKILEAVRYGVSGYELDGFMHGIYHSIWNNDYMFYIGAKGKYYNNMLKMKKYFEENRKNHNFIFTADKTQDDGKNFVADFIDDEKFSFLEYIIPFQVITARLSADLGINANIPSDPDFHKKMGSYKF